MTSQTPASIADAALTPAHEGYRVCTRCVMDTSDPEVSFDTKGECSHCARYDATVGERLILDPVERDDALGRFVDSARAAGRGRDYDCVIGVSGGVDSTYVAYLTRELGLRPLAVHLDNGWNSELAVDNIQQTLDRLNIDLYTHVLDWESFRDLQLSFLHASTPDGEVPTDHAIYALLIRKATELGIRTVLSGMNYQTEGGAVRAWAYGHSDWHYIRGVHRQFGSVPLVNYPHYTPARLAYALGLRRLKIVGVLNYVDYVKQDALHVLADELGYRPYPSKHYESIYTRFYQGYILPEKFGIDKRRLHESDLIRAGQVTRPQALAVLATPTYDLDLLRQDRTFVLKKMALSEDAFQAIMDAPPRTYRDYPNNSERNRRLRVVFDALRRRGLIPR